MLFCRKLVWSLLIAYFNLQVKCCMCTYERWWRLCLAANISISFMPWMEYLFKYLAGKIENLLCIELLNFVLIVLIIRLQFLVRNSLHYTRDLIIMWSNIAKVTSHKENPWMGHILKTNCVEHDAESQLHVNWLTHVAL